MAETPYNEGYFEGPVEPTGRFQYGSRKALMAHILLGEFTDKPDEPDTGGEQARLHGPSPSDIGGIALEQPRANTYKDTHEFKLAA